MQKPSLATGALSGAITSLPVIALFYLGDRFANLPFFPFDFFDWLARVLPGSIITFTIDSMVLILTALGLSVSETSKLAEQLMALAMFVFLGAILGLVIAILMPSASRLSLQAGAIVGLVLFIIVIIVEFNLGISGNPLLVFPWLLLLTAGWGAAIAYSLQMIESASQAGVPAEGAATDEARRDALLKLVGGSVGLAFGAWGLASFSRASSRQTAAEAGAGQPLSTAVSTRTTEVTGQAAVDFPPTPSGRFEPAPGTRPEVMSNEEFYRIDINTRPPVVDGESWQLEVSGLFENLRNLTLGDLMAFPVIVQPLTLSCISNRVGGDLIGTSYWTGVRLRDVLEDLQLRPEAGALYMEAADGFYETIIAEDMMDERTLLVYGMNGETLPTEHGYPLRILIPNRYGMKQPKWIVRMEAIEAWRPGYWVDRGWSREAYPQMVSVVDTVAVDAIKEGIIPVGGIAWAGDRGIQKVEVRVDEGEWVEAELREPTLSNLTWVQWRYDWPAESGRHTFTVRATDGTGTLQIEERSDPHPNGSTGYHSKTVSV